MKVVLLTHDAEDNVDANWKIAKYDEFMKITSSVDIYINKIKMSKNNMAQNIRVKKLRSPNFNGNVRNYMRFIKDFENLVLPSVAPEQSAFALRQCLSPDVKTYLGNDDDISSMLKTLEQRYGDPGKLVESVVEEVQRFRKIGDDDNKKLIQFINTIDRGYHDLKNLRLEKEISNAHVVSVIENKLPSKLRNGLVSSYPQERLWRR